MPMQRNGHFSAANGQSSNSKSKSVEKGRSRMTRQRQILMQACLNAYGIEILETRMMLAADFWTGAGANANWSTGANWLGGNAPRPGDDLVFPVSNNTSGVSASVSNF